MPKMGFYGAGAVRERVSLKDFGLEDSPQAGEIPVAKAAEIARYFLCAN